MDIAILGCPSFTLGFRLAGVRRIVSTERGDYAGVLEKALRDPTIGILVVSEEDLIPLSQAWRTRLSDSVRPVVISVGKSGEDDIRERIKRAIGLDLYRKEK
jgi:V/A-type H+-transporting ATPase subunit F